MRKMASVCTIKDLTPVPKTDNLLIVSMHENLYTVLGNRAQNLEIGEKVVYFEVDSLLPLEPCYDFLKARCYNDRLKKYRIKAMKMRGVYSFGLILKGSDIGIDLSTYNSGDDLTEILGVGKFEPVDDASPRPHKKSWKDPFMRFKWFRWIDAKFFNKGLEDFPTYIIPKSDEENLWNNPEFFTEHLHDGNYISIKMEGKSVTCFWEKTWYGKKFKVFGRNKELCEPFEIKWFNKNIAPKLLKSSWTKEHNVVLQGECCAPKIQSGIYKNGIHFYVYKIKDLETKSYLTLEQMRMYCKMHDLETVPILEGVKLNDFKSIKDLYNFTESLGFVPSENVYNVVDPKKNKNARHHEGIVVASSDRNAKNWSFKVKSQEYQLGK